MNNEYTSINFALPLFSLPPRGLENKSSTEDCIKIKHVYVETQFKLPVEHEICLDPLKTLFSSNGQLCVFYWIKSVDVTFLKENHFPKNVPYYFTIYGMIFRYQTRRSLLSYCCKGIVTSN